MVVDNTRFIPDEPTPVYVRINLFDIQKVDTAEQLLTLSLYFEEAWEWEDRPEVVPKGYVPETSYANLDFTKKRECDITWQVFVADKEYDRLFGKKMFCRRVIMNVVIPNKMNLRMFPYDTQHFTVGLRTNWDTKHFVLRPNPHNGSTGQYAGFSTANEFLYPSDPSDVVVEVFDQKSNRKDTDTYFGNVKFLFRAQRRSGHVFWHVLFPMFVLSTLSLTSFVIPVTSVADRYSVLLTVLLSVIAYKFVVVDQLPRVFYLTFTDKYVFLSAAFLISIIAETYICNAFVSKTDAARLSNIDWYLYVILASIWIVCNAGVVLWISGTSMKQWFLRSLRGRKNAEIQAAPSAK